MKCFKHTLLLSYYFLFIYKKIIEVIGMLEMLIKSIYIEKKTEN
jgi:hypothetical protein